MGLRIKIMLPCVLLVIALVGGTGYFSYREAAESLRDALVDNMEGEAGGVVRAMHMLAETAMQDMQRESHTPDVRNFFAADSPDSESVASMNKSLAGVIGVNKKFERLSLVSKTGVILASTAADTIGKDFTRERDYFKKAMQGETYISQPFRSGVTGRGVLAVAAPVGTGGGAPAGVIYGILSLEDFYKNHIDSIKVGAHGYSFILASSGEVAVHKNHDMLFKSDLPAMPTYKAMVAEREGSKEYRDNLGKLVFAMYRTEPLTKTVAVVRAEVDDIFSGLIDIRTSTAILVGISVVLACLIVFLIVHPVVNALQKGVAFAAAVAAGNLDETLSVKNKDETGKLAAALRTIPESLKRIISEFKELEKKIETGQLGSRGDFSGFTGEFATLVKGSNAIMDRFGLVLDSIPSSVIIRDKNGRATYLNKTARDVIGEVGTEKGGGELFRRDDYGTPQCGLRRVMETNRPATAETRAHPGGKEMDIRYTSIPMHDSSGRMTSILQLITDLTEIKSAQRTMIEVAQQATDISSRMAAASEKLSSQVEQATRGSSIQRDRVSGTAASMEEMNATVLEVARTAGKAAEQAESSRLKAGNGAELVNKVIASVQQVNSVAQELQTDMQQLGVQAEAIGGVMNVISDIADQTNLLALNAAIEAARAGEAGRGFAVVADEVRKLAEKTMTATSEVGGSIRGIQTATTANLARVSDATRNISEATELAGVSGAALGEILELANATASLISGIATAAEEQSATSEEINRAIEEISRIADETSSGMMQSSSAVHEVAQMSQHLRELLDKLRVQS